VKDFKKIDETSDIIQCVLRARLHPCPLETLLGERGDVVFFNRSFAEGCRIGYQRQRASG
jgi:hypothetical protein